MQFSRRREHDPGGFTIAEIAVVGGMVAVLLGAVVLLRQYAAAQARDAQRVSDVQQVRAGLERYFHDHDRYPEAAEAVALGRGTARCLDEDGLGEACDDGGTAYLSPVPADPGDGSYVYSAPEGLTYQITFRLERSLANLAAGPHVADPEGIR